MTGLEEQYNYLIDAISKAEMTMLPSEFAEKYINISSAVSSVPGKMNYDLTPYAREIVDTLSPYHPAKIVGIKKGAQIGLSQGLLVPGIVWSIAQNPTRIAAFSANDELTKKMMIRVDEAISSAGIQHLIKPNTIKKRNARTGDTLNNKEFVGGDLMASTLKSIDKLSRQNSFAVGLFDDWSSSDVAFKKQGNIFELLQQRFSTAANTMKQYYISTPENEPDPIEQVYQMGDQRKWMLECPCCGKRIEIKWKQIKWTTNGKFLNEDSVCYECQECSNTFTEKSKYDMNLNGIWIPTATPSQPGFYSYHITALVSAPFMYSWTDYVYKWLKTYNKGNQAVSKLKVFMNQVLGETWKEKRKVIKSSVLAKNTRDYVIGVIPNSLSKKDGNGNIILLTCACDLGGNLDDGRLDYEVKAWSENGSSYSIDAGSIGTYQAGKALDGRDLWTYRNEAANYNIWTEFYDNVVNRDYEVDNGNTLKITMTGIDIGYHTKYAWRFIDTYKSQLTGVKGSSHEDKFTPVGKDVKLFSPGKERPNLWLLQGDKLKDKLSESINLNWNRKYGQPDGFMNFPEPSAGKYTVPGYFSQYENESKETQTNDDGEAIGYKWKRKNNMAANHFFDCAFYNIAIKEIVVSEIGKALKRKDFTWLDFVEFTKSSYGGFFED